MDGETSKGVMVTNETLAKVTKGSHYNPKGGGSAGGSNGFRIPSHLNGKTPSSLSTSVPKCSNPDQPRRSVITLKNAPGPPVNSSGTGVLKTKSCNLDRVASEIKASVRGGRSRKRSREGDSADVPNHDERKDGREQSTSASETLEPSRRRRRGQGSKKVDKKNSHLPVAESSVSKLKVTNSAGVSGILDIYGLKTKPVDVSRLLVDTPLDKLLSGNLEPSTRSAAMENESGSESRLVIDEINNVMQLLPKHTFVQKPFAENALNEDVKVRLTLDLERPLEADECQHVDDGTLMIGSLEKAKSKSLELFPTFRLEDLPLHTVEDFRERLKLLTHESLEALISYSKPTDASVSASEKTSRFEGIPPSPFSFPASGVRIEASRNGRTAERQWTKETATKVKSEQRTPKAEAGEATETRSGALPVRPKLEQPDEGVEASREQEKGKLPVDTVKKCFPELPALQLKRDEGETSQSRRSINFPAMPCSPGVEAATILCNMANSDRKEFNFKGKRHGDEQGQRTSKLARIEDRDGSSNAKRETTGAAGAGVVKKSPVSEKRKSLSQVNHSLSSVSKRPNLDTGPPRSSNTSKSEEHMKESGRQVAAKVSSHPAKLKESHKDSGSGKNGMTGASKGGTSNSSAGKSPSAAPPRKETLTVPRSRCFVSGEPAGSVIGPRTTVSIKSSRRNSFEGKPRSKHGDLRACSKLRD